MARQIGGHFQEPSMIILEMRLRRLEEQVSTLAMAVRALAHALEDGPLAEPGERPVGEAARQAHDLSLLVEGWPAESEAARHPAAHPGASQP
jgi:hypothetical protein